MKIDCSVKQFSEEVVERPQNKTWLKGGGLELFFSFLFFFGLYHTERKTTVLIFEVVKQQHIRNTCTGNLRENKMKFWHSFFLLT